MSGAIIVRPHESPMSALRRFKKAVEVAGILGELRKREHFVKPSDRRRSKRHRAIARMAKGGARV